MLEQFAEAVAGAEDDSVEMLLRKLQLSTNLAFVFVMQIKSPQQFAVPRNAHLIERSPHRSSPLRAADIFPLRVILCIWHFIQSVRIGDGGSILAPMIAQVIERDTVEIPA